MRIAIAEPDAAVADLLVFVAQRRGHQPVCVTNAGRLFERLPFTPSVAIIALNRLDDRELATIAQLHKAFPEVTLLVTSEETRNPLPMAALRAGAHDVVRTPYNPHEVIVRAEAWHANRSATAGRDDQLQIEDLDLDLGFYSATKNGHPLLLTKLELRLLYALCEHYPRLAPIDRLLAFGWEASGDPEPTLLKTHISHLRRKLREAGGVPFEITSRQTLGYTLAVGGEAAQAG